MIDRALSAKRESKTVDFKRSLDPDSAAECCELVKDVIAMANSGGGVVLIGVDDNGTCNADPTVAKVLGLDPAHLTDKIAKYTGVQFDDFTIVEGQRTGVVVAVLSIGAAPAPIIFEKPGTYAVGDNRQKSAFGAGTVYVRHGAKSEPATNDDLRLIVERRIQAVRREWLSGVRKVVNAPAGSAVSVLPREVRQSTSPEATPIRITSEPTAPEYRLVNPDTTHPWRQKELIAEVNNSLADGHNINQFDVQAVRHLYSIDSEPRYYHKSRFAAPQYSPAMYEWLLEQYQRDASFFVRARAEFKQRRAAEGRPTL